LVGLKDQALRGQRHNSLAEGEEIKHNIKISVKESLGYYELKQQKPWFDKGFSNLLDQEKQANLQWLQDPGEINGDNLNNVRHESSRQFRNKKRECLNDKLMSLQRTVRTRTSQTCIGE
jgi:hypothetical protein